MYHYKSDTTQFLDQLIDKHPELDKERLDNRNLLWDVQLNAQEQADFEAANISKKPYAYQTD